MSAPPDAMRPQVVEVAAGVYAYVQPNGSWWINNTGFIAGRTRVIGIDACATQRRTQAFRQAITKVTQAPVDTLINTHHHGDHTHGNYLFPEATIVGHERTREEILAAPPLELLGVIWDAPDWGDVVITPPGLTFSDRITLYADELRCEVRHVGTPAHTTNDSIVWLAEHEVLFAGDLVFNGGTPFVLMGSVAGSIEVLEEVKTLGARTIVPGHGDVCGPEIFDEVLGYLRFVQDTARAGKAAGLTPLEAAHETDLGRYGNLGEPERLAGNLHRAYSELAGAPRDASVDLIAALQDMVTYSGGERLRCLA